MIVHQFRVWAQTASPSGRADGASALARAYLYSDLSPVQRREALDVLTAFLDDPSPLVRRSLAEAFASAADAPAHIVLALADDQPSIAGIVLARSPVLTDASLVDCAVAADATVQAAIAGRPMLSQLVIATLAEIGAATALVALARNTALCLSPAAIARMVERHGGVAELREALLARQDLPASVRVDLVAAATRALAQFVCAREWLSNGRMQRVSQEARDKAAIVIAATDAPRNEAELVAHLRKKGQLSVGLVLRAILSGRFELFKTALSDLSGVAIARVDGLVGHHRSAGFAALYRRAGLPEELLPAFRLALEAAQEQDWTSRDAGLSRSAVERVLTGCEALNEGHLDKLLVLLRRFEAEAARDESRRLAARQADAAIALVERPAPLLLTDLDSPTLPSAHARPVPPPRRRVAPRALDINLAALESELCAA